MVGLATIWQRNKPLVVLTLGAFLVRLILIPLALHVDSRFVGDLIAINRSAFTFLFQPHFSKATYPPLALYTIGLFQALWHSPVTQGSLSGPEVQLQLLSAPNIFYFLFASKTLYFLFDLLSAFFLARLFQDNPRQSARAWLFWILNPVIIYNAYFHGQFDLLPIFFVILSFYFAKEQKPRWAAFWIGIAGCYKNFPFFFLLPLALVLTKSWRERLILVLLGAVPYVLLMAPFLEQYRSGIGNYPIYYFKASYDLGFGAQVYVFIVFYAVLLWYLHHRQTHTFEDLWRACFAILLVYYQLSYFDLHYWAWIVPFAALYWIERPAEAKLFYLAIGLCLLALLAPTPLARFFAPISPRFFLRLPSLLEILTPYLPMLFILNVVRSLLAGTCFYLAWHVLRDTPAARAPALPATPEAALAA